MSSAFPAIFSAAGIEIAAQVPKKEADDGEKGCGAPRQGQQIALAQVGVITQE